MARKPGEISLLAGQKLVVPSRHPGCSDFTIEVIAVGQSKVTFKAHSRLGQPGRLVPAGDPNEFCLTLARVRHRLSN